MDLNSMDFGTDPTKVEEYIADLQLNLIEACVTAMNDSHSNLTSQIQNCWQGAAADRFLNSYKQSITSASNMLTELKGALEKYMLTVKNSVLNTEASLWNETENPFSGNAELESHKWSE